MPRWEHGSKERLQQAALELFAEQGFQHTSAVQIAQRARVTTRTFFRYFADKKDVVFADAELLSAALVQGVLEDADVAHPLRTVVRTLAGFDWLGLGSLEVLRQRDEMIAANPGLLERELIKQDQLAEALGRALQQRGVDSLTAEVAARVGIDVFRIAYRRWLAGDGELAATVDAVMPVLGDIVP